MRIIVTINGVTHYQAHCHDCDFEAADHIDRKGVRRLVYKHIRETGHRVSIEKGISTHYEKE